jgi:hypothetical protein
MEGVGGNPPGGRLIAGLDRNVFPAEARCADGHVARQSVEAFLADKSPNKREKLIDEILASDEFVDYWAYKWSDLLLVSSKKLRPAATRGFYSWIHESVKANKPWDRFVREILTSSGSTRQNGALNYFVLHKDPIDLTENVTQAFLGQRLTCARCHNHPLEKWTQKQYYQMANLFSRVGIKNGSTAEMVRLNTALPVTRKGMQNSLGAAQCFVQGALVLSNPGCDPAGFPNGRRPGDDVVDIELRVAMGFLLPLADAPSGQLAFTDAAINEDAQFDETFPYLVTPTPGAM